MNALNPLARLQICRELDIKHPLGGDYQTLAALFNMSTEDIEKISQKPNPTDNVLVWMGRKPINTIAKLRNVLVTMERDDCVEIIDKSLQSGMYCYFRKHLSLRFENETTFPTEGCMRGYNSWLANIRIKNIDTFLDMFNA